MKRRPKKINLNKRIIVIAGFVAIIQSFFIMKGHEEHKERPSKEEIVRGLIVLPHKEMKALKVITQGRVVAKSLKMDL